MSQHQNEHDDLKGPHKWTRAGGYEPVAPEENEAASESSPAGASETGDDPARVNEAVEFVMNNGHDREAAEFIVSDQGVNSILKMKQDRQAETDARREAAVPQTHIQAPAEEPAQVAGEAAAYPEEDDIASA